MIASPIPAIFAECGDRGLAEQGRHNRDRAVLQILRSREKNWPPLLRLTATRTVANFFLLPCSAAKLSVEAKGYDIRASPLAKNDSEVIRGHVISLLQLEYCGSVISRFTAAEISAWEAVGGNRSPAPFASTRAALSAWSRPIGRMSRGRALISERVTVPWPPCDTTTETSFMTKSWGAPGSNAHSSEPEDRLRLDWGRLLQGHRSRPLPSRR